MRKNGWKLLLVLLCVAFLVSCGKKEGYDGESAELVSVERSAAESGALFSRGGFCLHPEGFGIGCKSTQKKRRAAGKYGLRSVR